MKILNVSTSSLVYNGIGIVLLNYYQNIKNNDIQLDYISPSVVPIELKKSFTVRGNNIFELTHNNKKMRQKRPIKYCIKLYKIIKRENYDIIHVHGSSSMMVMELLVAKFAGVKFRIAHSHNTKSDNKILNFLFRPLFKKSYTHAFACGKEAGIWLFGNHANFKIIPNGKNCDLYEYNIDTRKKIRKKYNYSENDIVIGHIGNFIEQKNHKFLLKIFKELTLIDKNYKLLLIGFGNLLDEIKILSKQLKLDNQVLFLGQVPVEETAKIIQGMDIMVFPSLFEGFPNVLIECQISGLPCVISDKITKEVKITDLVYFKSINKSPNNWANFIKTINTTSRLKNKSKVKQQIVNAGFDIKENAKMLEQFYMNIYKRNL